MHFLENKKESSGQFSWTLSFTPGLCLQPPHTRVPAHTHTQSHWPGQSATGKVRTFIPQKARRQSGARLGRRTEESQGAGRKARPGSLCSAGQAAATPVLPSLGQGGAPAPFPGPVPLLRVHCQEDLLSPFLLAEVFSCSPRSQYFCPSGKIWSPDTL